MERKIRTIAFQVDDPDFIEQYERRVKESGLKVKDYHIGLVKADIALNQTQENNAIQEGGDQDEAFTPEQEAAPSDIAEQPDEASAPAVTDAVQDAAPEPEQNQVVGSVQNEEMMNLFVKITKDQRESLDSHKLETGETVGNVLNRIIDDFLDHTDSLPEDFEETYKHYSDNIQYCDTTCSAKIPVRVNQELADYLNSFGGSRNALMASLVELELRDQELTEVHDQDAGMQQM